MLSKCIYISVIHSSNAFYHYIILKLVLIVMYTHTCTYTGSLHHRRQALAFVYDKELVASLFEQAPERYKDRQGGYSRVIREDLPRRGDSAQMAIIELV